MHYIDEGKGQAIVMFHSNPTWSFLYRKVILALRDRFRCIAMDYPGFGLSERPTGYRYTPAEHAQVVGRLVDHLALDRFMVVGQDWGGPIGMTVAVDRGDRVSGIVFANTWYFVLPRTVVRKLDPDVFAAYQRAQPSAEARRGVAEFPRQIRLARPMLTRLAEKAPEVLENKPIELVWAMKDAFGRQHVIERWLRDFPTANVTRLPEASQYTHEDASEAVAAAVRRAAL